MLKRIFDIILASVALLLLLPLMLVVAVCIRISMGAPVFFRQVRPGLNGEPFVMLKFRTMSNMVDTTGRLLTDEIRLTVFGQFLRRTSIDELPELWNIIRGDMSLVGPRPLLMEYLPLYSSHQARRHELRPGLTGWAQVNGRNAISWEEKFDYDVWYIDNHSFGLDLKILLMTVIKVFKSSGIAAQNHATMPIFKGSKESE